MNSPLPPPPFTVRQTARYLGVSVPTVYRLLRSGKLKAVLVGGQWRVTQGALTQLLENSIDVD